LFLTSLVFDSAGGGGGDLGRASSEGDTEGFEFCLAVSECGWYRVIVIVCGVTAKDGDGDQGDGGSEGAGSGEDDGEGVGGEGEHGSD